MINRTQEEIMQNWGVDNSNNPLVSVKCMTYNHENYIAQALDGFLMQKTTFPFEVLVHDDASTDRTADIVREYEQKFPKIIKGIYEEKNQWATDTHNVKIDAAIKGKYVAICEGDDYWIDENKLQMQVDFLEKNPEYGMCYTMCKCYVQGKKKYIGCIGNNVKDFYELLQKGNRIPALTVCFKKSLYTKYLEEKKLINKNWEMGDYPLWLYISSLSKIKFYDDVTSVYRILDNSASHFTDVQKKFNFEKSVYEIRCYFAKKNNIEIPELSDEYIMYHVYISSLLASKYSSSDAKKVRQLFIVLREKSLKDYIYFFCSYSPFLWFMLKKIKKIIKN